MEGLLRPRILFLTTETPWPLDGGGKLRSFETLACLSSLADVSVVSVSESADPSTESEGLATALPGLRVLPPVRHPIRIRRNPLALARTAALQVVLGEPYLAAKFQSARYLARALAEASGADVVWCDHLNVFPAARLSRRRAAPGAALVLDEHNVESDLFLRAGRPGVLGRLIAVEGARAARFESLALRRADAVVAISPDDASRLSELGGGERVTTLLPGVGELASPLPPPPPGDTVAFLGTLSWPPNLEAARFLGREVLPRLRRRRPSARILVGGKGLGLSEQRELTDLGLELVGYVADAVAFLRSCAVAAVPLLSGSGIAMKTLDSLKAGVPTVATPVGARGLPLPDGEAILLADGPDAFTEALDRALGDVALRVRLAEGGHRYLAEHHGRTALIRGYGGVLERAMARAAARGAP